MSLSLRLLPPAAAIALAALAGCTRVATHQGYVADAALVAAIQPGIDNRDSVAGTLGRPTFAAEFDPNTWYYVSRDTRQFAFANPKPVQQMVLEVRFDANGNVASVRRTGLEKVASVAPWGEKTPTLGRNRSFFGELFGNIGQVGGSGRGAPTTDNPDQ